MLNGLGMTASFVHRWEQLNAPVLHQGAKEPNLAHGGITSLSKVIRQLTVQILMMCAGAYHQWSAPT
ncbi:MAG: hypothetical protein IPG20_21135 [Gammaproteobacteria bacterium]|nr:hypothetical protein [Gammaproteobacteria bacterium]